MPQFRRWFAALSLGVALAMATPAPSWAAGLGDWPTVLLNGKAWQWVATLWPGGDEQVRDQRARVVRRKEGSMIDPNGSPTPNPDPTGSSSGTSGEEGSMIDPNGNQ